MEEITKNIKFFIHNPLGIMALFVTVCYGIAGMVFSTVFLKDMGKRMLSFISIH